MRTASRATMSGGLMQWKTRFPAADLARCAKGRSGYVPGTAILSRIRWHLAAHDRTGRLGVTPGQATGCWLTQGRPSSVQPQDIRMGSLKTCEYRGDLDWWPPESGPAAAVAAGAGTPRVRADPAVSGVSPKEAGRLPQLLGVGPWPRRVFLFQERADLVRGGEMAGREEVHGLVLSGGRGRGRD